MSDLIVMLGSDGSVLVSAPDGLRKFDRAMNELWFVPRAAAIDNDKEWA